MKQLKQYLVCLSIFCIISSLFSKSITEYDRALEYLNDRNEVYFRTDFNTTEELEMIASNFVIDYYEASFVYLYADKESFPRFTKLNKWYEVLEHPGDYPERLAELGEENIPKVRSIEYPSSGASYSGFENMVQGLETDYPEICKVMELGQSSSGKKIWGVKVSNDPSIDQCKPLFVGTGTMHGDEPTGFMCILYLIDWLGANYGSDQQATAIVDNNELYFIPLVNPSGSYNSSGNYGRQVRATPNCADINRSFPVPEVSPQGPLYPSGDKERDIVVDLYEAHSFSIGVDLHTGMTSCVLPWGCTTSDNYAHPDFSGYLLPHANAFVQEVGGMSGGAGWAAKKWYTAYGVIFDWSVVSHGDKGACMCYCLELGSKQVSASDVLYAWNKYKDGFIYFIEQLQFGIHGVIKCGDEPVRAKITVDDHDEFGSNFFSDQTTGYFVRPIEEGTFSLTLTYEQYTVEIPDVTVQDNQKTDLGIIEMSGTNLSQKVKTLSTKGLSAKTTKDMIIFNNNSTSDAIFDLFTLNGSKVRAFTVKKGTSVSYNTNTLVLHATGIYVVTVKNQTTTFSQRITIW